MKLFQILLFIIIGVSNLSFSQQQSDTSKVLLTFSKPMSHEGIFDIHNYRIYKDDLTQIKIFKVGVFRGDSLIVLFTEKQSQNSTYKVVINNLKDKYGNVISESHKAAVY